MYGREVEKLRHAYFPDGASADAIPNENIALESAAVIIDGVLKAVTRQAGANDGGEKCCSKKTFLYRLIVEKLYSKLRFNICSIERNEMHSPREIDLMCLAL